jgi:hypothetical protein
VGVSCGEDFRRTAFATALCITHFAGIITQPEMSWKLLAREDGKHRENGRDHGGLGEVMPRSAARKPAFCEAKQSSTISMELGGFSEPEAPLRAGGESSARPRFA